MNAETNPEVPAIAPEPVSIDIRAAELAALLKIAPKDEVRYYLNGIYFDPTGYAVVTDGHVLMALQSKPFTGAGFIIPRGPVEACLRGMTAKHRDAWIVQVIFTTPAAHTSRGELVTFTGRFGFESIDGRFPDWRRVVPRECSGERAYFDHALIARMESAIAELRGYSGKNAKRPVLPIAENGKGPGMIQTGDECMAIVMPWKYDAFEPEHAATHARNFFREFPPKETTPEAFSAAHPEIAAANAATAAATQAAREAVLA